MELGQGLLMITDDDDRVELHRHPLCLTHPTQNCNKLFVAVYVRCASELAISACIIHIQLWLGRERAICTHGALVQYIGRRPPPHTTKTKELPRFPMWMGGAAIVVSESVAEGTRSFCLCANKLTYYLPFK